MWYRNVPTKHIDVPFTESMHAFIDYLRSTSTAFLLIISGITPSKSRPGVPNLVPPRGTRLNIKWYEDPWVTEQLIYLL